VRQASFEEFERTEYVPALKRVADVDARQKPSAPKPPDDRVSKAIQAAAP